MVNYSFESEFPVWYKKLLQEDPSLEELKKLYKDTGSKLAVIKILWDKEYIPGLLEAKTFFDKFLERKLNEEHV